MIKGGDNGFLVEFKACVVVSEQTGVPSVENIELQTILRAISLLCL